MLAGLLACGGSDITPPLEPQPNPPPATPAPSTMTVLGRGDVAPQRTTAEVAVRGNTAYTTTWGNSASVGSVFYIWDVSGNVPALLDSVRVSFATTLGDVAISDDGALLTVATEHAGGGLLIYSLADPRRPTLLSRFTNANTAEGVHTAEIGRVGGRLYAFLCIDPSASLPSRLVIVDLDTPTAPTEVLVRAIGRPFVHDTFVRDGLLYLALWDDGVAIWDIGGGGRGGTVSAPVELGRVQTANGNVHNVWWLKDPVTNITRYAFIGEEGESAFGASSTGNVHVVDVSVPATPREVAYYTVPGAGTHNFSVDEASGILYAAYYNGGIRALDVRGELGNCTASQKSSPRGSAPLCDLRLMGREIGVGLLDRPTPVFVWGVHFLEGSVYASDMLNGLWKLRALSRP
ncbi:MAG: hypothetical protein ABIV10_04650 [Gemmatimonadaceae bacterium]